jgi:predicted nucleotidyltransferase
MLHPFLKDKLPKVIELFNQYHVKRAFAFGSVINDKFNESSDIDLLLSMEDGLDPIVYGGYYLDLWDALEQLFQRKVDLLTEGKLKNRFLIQ